jgi:hypothetical protein
MKVYKPKLNFKGSGKVLLVGPDYEKDRVEQLVENLRRFAKRRKS